MYATVWSEYPAPDASTDRGWLKATCAPFNWDDHLDYNSGNMPVWDEDINGWREQSTLGNYLDYRPCRPHVAADVPCVHAVCYVTSESGYHMTVDQAKAWIEERAASVRKDLAFQMQLVAIAA